MEHLVYSMMFQPEHFVIPKFRVREFAHVGSKNIVLDPVALMALNNFRQALNRPVHITSGYRTVEHNTKVGGVPNSLHLIGAAFDMAVEYNKAAGWIVRLREAGFTEILYYPDDGHIHAGVQHGTQHTQS